MEKIKVIIADNNKEFNDIIRSYLEKFDEIEILGSSYSNEEEIFMIDNLNPEIVITDLVRNGTLSGLEIIRKYKKQKNSPKFLVITGGGDELIDVNVMDGFIKKPFIDYNLIIKKLKNIKELIEFEKADIE